MGKKQQSDPAELRYACISNTFRFDTGDHVLTIINSNKQRSLTESKYNERFNECGMALTMIETGSRKSRQENLCEFTLKEFESVRHLLKDPVLEKRASM